MMLTDKCRRIVCASHGDADARFTVHGALWCHVSDVSAKRWVGARTNITHLWRHYGPATDHQMTIVNHWILYFVTWGIIALCNFSCHLHSLKYCIYFNLYILKVNVHGFNYFSKQNLFVIWNIFYFWIYSN